MLRQWRCDSVLSHDQRELPGLSLAAAAGFGSQRAAAAFTMGSRLSIIIEELDPLRRKQVMRLKLLPIVAVGAAALALAVGYEASAKYEEPPFSVLKSDGDFEIRQYPSVIAAQIEVDGKGEEAANKAFRILAGYIFGKNVSKSKIAMTVPVTEQMRSEKIAMTVPVTTMPDNSSMIMHFYMPSKYKMEELPEPSDKRIKFLSIAARKYAVVRFSGFASESSMQSQTSLLRSYMQKNSLTGTGEPIRAFYNPPWTLPFMRRNEVWIQISD